MSADMYAIIRNPAGPSQTVAYTGSAGTIGARLPHNAQSILVLVTTHAYVKISFAAAGTAATTTDIPVAAGIPTVIPLQRPTAPGQVQDCWVSAIQLAAGGSLVVLPLAE